MEIIPLEFTTIKQDGKYNTQHPKNLLGEYFQIDTNEARSFETYKPNFDVSQPEIDHLQVEFDKFPLETLDETVEEYDAKSTYTITRNVSVSSSVGCLEFDICQHACKKEENITCDINSNTLMNINSQQIGVDN